jgi:hypothetical protein
MPPTVSYSMKADLDSFEYDKVVSSGLGAEEIVEKEISDVKNVISSIESDIEVIESPVIDISIPYDAAAKLAYEASDKSMTYGDFKVKYEADSIELVKSKQSTSSEVEEALAMNSPPKDSEAFQRKLLAAKLKYNVEASESESENIVDVSIPYDAAAKYEYEASDKSVPYDEFRAKYEEEAVKLVKSKQKPSVEVVEVNTVKISPEVQMAKEMEAKQRALLAARLQASSTVVMK